MYFLRRILFAIPLLLVISALAFVLVHLAPGGPFDTERKPASPAFGHDAQAWAKYLCQSHARIFKDCSSGRIISPLAR